MSQLHKIKPHPYANKKRRRVGRGAGSGRGKTSGKGHKGQKQHNKAPRPGFEGGQMPLLRTIPKRGFSARSKPAYQILNIRDLAVLDTKELVTLKSLIEKNVLKSEKMPLKILGQGDINVPLHIQAQAFSKSAFQKIEKAGGKCELLGKA